MSIAAIVDAMVTAGCTSQQIAAAVRAHEEAAPARSKHAEAQAKYRSKKAAEKAQPEAPLVITGDHGDHDDHVVAWQKRKIPLHPLKEKEPTLKKTPPMGGQKKGSPIDPDWMPSPKAIEFARALGIGAEEEPNIRAEFIDFWISVPGAKSHKADWDATYRNRLRAVANNRRPATRAPPPGERPSALTRAFQSVARELHDKQLDRSNVVEIIPPSPATSPHGRRDWPDGELFGARGPVAGNPRRGGSD